MKEELDKKLVEKYPKIFADRHKSKMETAMCWGFECNDGWYDLIDNLCESIQNYIDSNDIPQFVASQVKEKFGGLRFYGDGGDNYIDGMISFAEDLSYKTCEKCGSIEDVSQTKNGWITSLCKPCMNELEYQQEEIHKERELENDKK